MDYDVSGHPLAEIIGDVQDTIDRIDKESPGMVIRAMLITDGELDFLANASK